MISLGYPQPIAHVLPVRTGGLRAPTEVTAVRGRLQEVARRHGFNGAAYMHLGHGLEAHEAGPRQLVAVGGLDEAAYRRRNFLAIDPLARQAARAFLPFVWSIEDASDDVAAAPLLRAMRAWGVIAGVVAPVQDYATGPAFLNLFAASAETLRIDPGALMLDASRLHADLRGRAGPSDAAAAPAELGAREIEVLRLAALGCTGEETAVVLGLSRRGVQFHLTRAMVKLGAPNKTAAVALAVSAGLIQL